jgi:hypothetical protein
VLPTGTELLARVTSVSPALDAGSRSSIGVLFVEAVTAAHERIDLRAGISRVLAGAVDLPVRNRGRVLAAASHAGISGRASSSALSEAAANTQAAPVTGSNGVAFSVEFPAPGNVPASDGGALIAPRGNLQVSEGTRIQLTVAAPAQTNAVSF